MARDVRGRQPSVVVLLAAVALLLHSALAQTSDTIDLAALPHRVVCTSQYTALDMCGTNGTVDDFSGYELELFKRVAQILASQGMSEWAPGNWSFLCLENYPPYGQLEQLCNVVANGATANTFSLYNELSHTTAYPRFSYSTYHGGRRIVVYRDSRTHIWTFLDPLQPSMWLLMFGSALLVGAVVLALEVPWEARGSSRGSSSSGSSSRGRLWRRRNPDVSASSLWSRYSNIQWAVTGLMLHAVHELSPSTSGGRVVVLGTAFTSLLLACMYTSSYTAHLTVSNLKSHISSMNDLTTLPVGIYEGDLETFAKFALQDLKLLPWMNYEDEQNMLVMLRRGEIAALVIDTVFADYQTSVNCDLYEVGEVVAPVNQGFQFAGGVPESYIMNFDRALQWLQSQGEMTQLANKFIRVPSNCPNKKYGNQADAQIKLGDVAGLWIFLAACLCLGVLWHLAVWLGMRFWSARLRRQQPAELPVSADASSNPEDAGRLAAIEHAVTLDERIQAVNERVIRIKRQLDAVPLLFASSMDKQLSELYAEVAIVLMKSAQFKEARSRGHEQQQLTAESNVQGTPGSIEEHLALITSKFNRMQDLQQK